MGYGFYYKSREVSQNAMIITNYNGKIVHYTEQLEEQILVRKTPATSSAGKCEATEYRCHRK